MHYLDTVYIHASSVHRTKGALLECNFEVGYLKELLQAPNSCKPQDRQKSISFYCSFQNTDLPLGNNLVFGNSLLNPYARCISCIKDTLPKISRSATALELAGLPCRHQINAAIYILTIILHDF